MIKWPALPLSEVAELITRGITPKYASEAGVIVINQRCIRDQSLNLDSARLHDADVKPVADSKYLQHGDGLVNSTGVGTLGRTAVFDSKIVDGPVTVDSHVTIVRPKQGLFVDGYLRYALELCEGAFIDLSTGSGGQTELSRSAIGNKMISLPPLDEQKRIVAKLDEAQQEFDRLNNNLEQQLSQLTEFDSALLSEMLGNPRQTPEPPVSTKWPLVRLDQCCVAITDGSHNPPKGVEFSSYPMLSSRDIQNDRIYPVGVRYLSEEDYVQENQRTNVTIGDVLLTIVGTIGRCAVYQGEPAMATFQRSVAVLRPSLDSLEPRYLMYRLQSMLQQLENEAQGAAQKGFYLKQLRSLEIPLPPLDEQKRIVAKLDEAFAQSTLLRSNIFDRKKIASELQSSILAAAFAGTL